MINYIGLDFEASGSNPWDKHVPIELGVSTIDGGFQYRIGGWNWQEWDWSETAYDVHGISQAELRDELPVWKVDILAAAQLIPNVSKDRMWNIMVGWNVAGYDGQFVTRWFPNLRRLLSYRTVDLNAIVFSMAGDNEEKYLGIKQAAKNYAAEQMGEETQWHNALYDARAALHSFEYLKEKVSG